jgi:hypothetical protein
MSSERPTPVRLIRRGAITICITSAAKLSPMLKVPKK